MTEGEFNLTLRARISIIVRSALIIMFSRTFGPKE